MYSPEQEICSKYHQLGDDLIRIDNICKACSTEVEIEYKYYQLEGIFTEIGTRK